MKMTEWLLYAYENDVEEGVEKDYLLGREEDKAYRTVTGIISKNKKDLSNPEKLTVYPVIGRDRLKKELFVQVEEVKKPLKFAKDRKELDLAPGEIL